MKNSRSLMNCMYNFINDLDDNDLEKLCSGEYKITLDKGESKKKKNVKKAKQVKKVKEVKKANVNNKDSVDIIKFEALHKDILICNSKEEAKKILEDAALTNNDLMAMGNYLNIKIPKSYNKSKIIGRLIDFIIGNKIEENSIC